MVPLRPLKPVKVAHEKAVAVHDDVRQAEADLHDANETLADTVVGSIVTKEGVETALVQSLHVEAQLHDAVKELEVVTELLKVAEEEKAALESHQAPHAVGRSGEGADSVIEHLGTSASRSGAPG